MNNPAIAFLSLRSAGHFVERRPQTTLFAGALRAPRTVESVVAMLLFLTTVLPPALFTWIVCG